MTKRVFSFLIFIVLLFSFIFAISGCKNSSVPLPDEFYLSSDEIVLTTPRDKATIYEGEVSVEDVTWGTDDPSVATFDNGVVKAVGPGTTEVFAEYFGVKHKCFVDCSSLMYTKKLIPEKALSTGEYDGNAVLAPPKSFDGPSEFFNDSAFIGDSVSLKLSYYAEDTGELGDALFLVSGNYGVAHAVEDTMQLYFQGKDMTPQDALATAGVKKVFIMLGMNDIGLYGVDKTVEYWAEFVKNIREKNPNIAICIQSMTPVYSDGQVGDLTNSNVDDYNKKLKEFASKNNCSYMDIASFMKDSDGGLASDYCSDDFVHLTDAGASAWTKVLKAYAGY